MISNPPTPGTQCPTCTQIIPSDIAPERSDAQSESLAGEEESSEAEDGIIFSVSRHDRLTGEITDLP